MLDRFDFGDTDYAYFDHEYNTTILNERAVEIPIAADFVQQWGIDLEVGNVLDHYPGVAPTHRVVDRFEVADGVENIDVFDIRGSFNSIVAISTLEHVRWDEPDRNPDGAIAALNHLRSLLTRRGRMLATVPVGHHPKLDEYLCGETHGALGLSTMVRWWGGWTQTLRPQLAPYGATTKWAEAVWIGIW